MLKTPPISDFILNLITKITAIFEMIIAIEFKKKEQEKLSRGMGVDLSTVLNSFNPSQSEIHDIKIQVKFKLHEFLISQGYTVNPHNKCILLQYPTSDRAIVVKILVYPNTVQIDIGCSNNPFSYNQKGALRLNILLEKICQYLFKKSERKSQIPSIMEWIVTHRHYGLDGDLVLEGKSFHITYEDLLGQFTRIYPKTLANGKQITRLEKIQTTKNTVRKELEKMVSPTT